MSTAPSFHQLGKFLSLFLKKSFFKALESFLHL